MHPSQYNRYNSTRNYYNPARYLECSLCGICLGITLYIIMEIPKTHILLKSFLNLSSGSFLIITFIDSVGGCTTRPMYWTSWIMFSMAGALLFFLCSGLLVVQQLFFGLILFLTALIMFAITAIVFLMDTLCTTITQSRKLGNVEDNLRVARSNKSSTTPSAKSGPSTPQAKGSDKANQYPSYPDIGQDKCIQYPSNAVLRRGKFTCTKESCANQNCPKKAHLYDPDVPLSHGGTFHVSKNVVPLLIPSKLPNSGRTNQTRSSGPGSSKAASKPANCPRAEVQLRTVCVTARSTPKRGKINQNAIDKCSEKPEEFPDEGRFGRMSKKACYLQEVPEGVNPQVEVAYPVQAHHYYNVECPHCWKCHQHLATVRTALPNLTNCLELANVKEVAPSDSSDQGSCPFSSPATQQNPSPASELSQREYVYSRYFSDTSASPQITTRSHSSCYRPQHDGSSRSSPRSDANSNKDQLIYHVTVPWTNRMENLGGDQLQADESQTWKGKLENCPKVDVGNKARKDESKQSRNWDERPCKDETAPAQMISEEKIELDTILPGSVDENFERSTSKKILISQPNVQKPTVIDMTPPDGGVSYLISTECPNRTINRRKKATCAII